MMICSTYITRIGFQYPPCRYNSVLTPVKSEKSLLRSTLKTGRMSFMPELEPAVVNETEAVDELNALSSKQDKEENGEVLTPQSGTGILDFVKSGLSFAKDIGFSSTKEAIKKGIPGAEAAIDVAEFIGDTISSPSGIEASDILSETFNENPAWAPGFAGEKHILLPTKFGITRANFAGPQTNIRARIRRGDVGVDGPNGIDIAARTHDMLYSLAKNKADIRAADNRLINEIKNSSQGEKTKNAAIAMLKAKLFGENIGIFGPETFTTLPNIGKGLKLSGSGTFSGGKTVRPSDTGRDALGNSLVGSISGSKNLSNFSGLGIGGNPSVAMNNRSFGSVGPVHLRSDLSSMHRGSNRSVSTHGAWQLGGQFGQLGRGRDMNMNFRTSAEFVDENSMNRSSGELKNKHLNPYDDESHKFGMQTGLGMKGGSSHRSFNPSGGGVKEEIEKIIKQIPSLPSARLKKELLKAERKVGKTAKNILGSTKKYVTKKEKNFLNLQKKILGIDPRGSGGQTKNLQQQKGGQFGLLAGLAASFLVPKIIKLIKGKGMSGGRLSKQDIEREILKIMHKPHIRRRIEPILHRQLGKLDPFKMVGGQQKGGQFGLLAGLASSFLVPKIIKLIRGRGMNSMHRGSAQTGKGFGSLAGILASVALPGIIEGIKHLF